MKTKFCVKKKQLLLIAGIVWMIAGFNAARLGVISYLNIERKWYLYLMSIFIFLLFGLMFFNLIGICQLLWPESRAKSHGRSTWMKISVKTKCRLFNFGNCFLLTYNIICHIIYKSIYYTAYNIWNKII